MATPRKPAPNALWKARARDQQGFDGADMAEPDPSGNRRQRRASKTASPALDGRDYVLTGFGEAERVIYESPGVQISTNIEGFKWPTRDEKIDGLLSAGFIDQAEADRLRAQGTAA